MPLPDQPSSHISEQSSPPFQSNHAICSQIVTATGHSAVPRTSDYWMRHIKLLHRAMQHPYDHRQGFFVDLAAHILHIISPKRLERAMKARTPLQWTSVKSAMDVLEARRRALAKEPSTNTTTITEPKLQILVMGGSVAEGDECNPRAKQVELQQRRRACAWPYRLQYMLDRLLGDDLVHVIVATVGGTNTEAALALLDYDLVPKEVDVVIHAYATNDMHAYTVDSAAAANTTLRDRIFDLTEQFVRRALTRCRPSGRPPPLLLYLDDYLGNEQNGIYELGIIGQTIPQLANYYGFNIVSYADSIRDLVYGSTAETYFSPSWKVMNESEFAWFFRKVHPGMGAHMTMTFLVLYFLLDLVLSYCSEPLEEAAMWKDGDYSYPETHAIFPELNNSFPLFRYYKVPHEPPANVLPPRIFPNLTLDRVTETWRHQAESSKRCEQKEELYEQRCIWAWVSRITSNCMIPDELQATMDLYLVENDGWIPELEHKKLGWVASKGLGSKFALEFHNLTQPVSSVMIQVMKSYGDQWENTTLQLKAASRTSALRNWRPRQLSVTEVTGYHHKKTSEQYTYVSKLVEGPRTQDLRVELDLISGNTSKIMGMAICSSES